MSSSANLDELRRLKARIARLRSSGVEPMEIIMSAATWEVLKAAHCAGTPGLTPKILSCREILGLRNKLVPGTRGCIIRYFGGMDLPPEQAVVADGFGDPAELRPVSRPSLN